MENYADVEEHIMCVCAYLHTIAERNFITTCYRSVFNRIWTANKKEFVSIENCAIEITTSAYLEAMYGETNCRI